MANPDTAPVQVIRQARVAPVAAGSDATEAVVEADFAGAVAAVSYIPDSTVTGAATNNRVISLVNKGQDGSGATVVASLTFGSGTNAAAEDETQLTLSGTAANLNVNQGDVLAFVSTHQGTGIADPGGLVRVTVNKSQTGA